jgi:hypothetical protein
MHSVVSGAVSPPSSREPRFARAFDEVVLRAMHRDPDARFASIGDLAAALLPFATTSVAARWQREFVPRCADATLDVPVETYEQAPIVAVVPDPSPGEPSAARILHCADGLAVAEVANVCVVIWRAPVTQSRFERQRSGLAEVVKRHPEGVAFLCVIEGAVTPPDDTLRKASGDVLASHGVHLKCIGCVIEATGFLAAVHRGVLTSMMFFLRPRSAVPVSFFSNVRDALRWTSAHTPIVSIGELASLVERIRAGLPPADADPSGGAPCAAGRTSSSRSSPRRASATTA